MVVSFPRGFGVQLGAGPKRLPARRVLSTAKGIAPGSPDGQVGRKRAYPPCEDRSRGPGLRKYQEKPSEWGSLPSLQSDLSRPGCFLPRPPRLPQLDL